jgi:Xaa-Pro aminopeptidase
MQARGRMHMRTDLDRLMADNDLDAIVVLSSGADPAVAYLTGSRKLTSALITKRRGQAASVAVSSIERDNVPESGLTLHLLDESVYAEAYRSSRSRMLAALELYTHTLDKMGIVRGRVGFHGRTSIGLGYRLLTHLTEALPAIEIITDLDPPVVGQARATKDESELSHMVDVGTRTSAVMVAARDYVRSHRVSGSGFIKPSGAPLTVSDVKRYTLGQLVESDLEDPEGMIFAPGAEGAVPHNPGQPDTQIRLGVPVVFDLFPRGIDGYFHDVTRTWCFGHAPDDVRALHTDVLGCFRQVVTAARPGATGEHLQKMACDYFRDRGHPVAADDRSRMEGFTTGLGHGVGLAVHEFPYLGEQQSTPLVPGHVFTVEPGLYYPGREMGVRIEDTLHCTSDGIVETITDVPYDLVVPLE